MSASSSAYEPVLSARDTSTLLGLPRSKQGQMLNLLYRLAERPDQPGDYTTRSEDGHDLQHLRLANWRVSF